MCDDYGRVDRETCPFSDTPILDCMRRGIKVTYCLAATFDKETYGR